MKTIEIEVTKTTKETIQMALPIFVMKGEYCVVGIFGEKPTDIYEVNNWLINNVMSAQISSPAYSTAKDYDMSKQTTKKVFLEFVQNAKKHYDRVFGNIDDIIDSFHEVAMEQRDREQEYSDIEREDKEQE